MRDEGVLRRLRVFIAGPSDVADEKNCIKTVIEELNRAGGVADKLGFILQPLECKQAIPGAGLAQNVILEEIPVETWDVFVGILWCRFGSATGAADDNTGQLYKSGTEEEFVRAYKQYREVGWPRMMIYRCQRSLPPYQVNPGQLALVEQFFDRLSAKGDFPGLWKPFAETTDLERSVRQDFTSMLHQLKDNFAGQIESTTMPVRRISHMGQIPNPEAPAGTTSPTLIPGQTYELSILSIDICQHSVLVERHPAESKRLLANFKKFVDRQVTERQGVYIDWTPDGGLFAFEGVNRADQAVLTGMALVKNVSVFNLDAWQNPLLHQHISIQIRVAAHDGLVLYEFPTNRISSSVINDVKHLESDFTDTGKFWVLDVLYRGLSSPLADRFSYRTLFKEMKVWSYDGVRSDWPPKDEELEHLVKHTEGISESLKNALISNLIVAANNESWQQIEALYSNLNQFLNWFRRIHDHWEETYLESIGKLIQRLLVSEGGFFDTLHGLCASLQKESKTALDINPVFQSVSARHADRIKLEQLLRSIRALIEMKTVPKSELPAHDVVGKVVTIEMCDVQLLEKIRRLTEADDLEDEVALTDLITTEREGLIRLIVSNKQIDNRKALLQKLWALSDLVLMEEKIQDAGQPIFRRLFAALMQDSWAGQKFTILKGLLEDQEPAHSGKVDSLLRTVQTADVEAAFDLQVVWRCLLAAHPNPAVVREAARVLPRDAIWRITAYSKVPVVAVQALAEVFESNASDDERKIFFDCVRPRLLAEITSGAAWQEVGNLIKQFFSMWNFFIEDHYFNRLEDLLSHYNSRAVKYGVNTEFFKEMMAKIRAIRIQKNDPSTQIPKGLESLGLAVQRHLARDGCHIDFFVLHPDDRIALETLPFIRLGNLQGWMYFRKINGKLFREILKRREFFGNSRTILLALNHPKCTPEFAAQYLPRVPATECARIAKNMNANTLIRNRAQQLASR